MNSYILIGYMGSGKSCVMKALADSLCIDGCDTDDYIEKIQGMSISKIFETKGEEYFRSLETDVIKKLLKSDNKKVIATGGGLPIYNKEILISEKKVIYLRANKETLVERLYNDDKRPLLEENSKDKKALEEKIERMLEKRATIYEELADIIIDVDNKSVDEIVEEIIKM